MYSPINFYRQALESEGKDPSTYEFEIIETPKKPGGVVKARIEGRFYSLVVKVIDNLQ